MTGSFPVISLNDFAISSLIFESSLYSHDGFEAAIFMFASCFLVKSVTSSTSLFNGSFAILLASDLILIFTFPSTISVLINPIFIEVSTSPSICLLISRTPLGTS